MLWILVCVFLCFSSTWLPGLGAQEIRVPFTCPNKGPIAVNVRDPHYHRKPLVDGAKKFMNGLISAWTGPTEPVYSPIFNESDGQRMMIGNMAQMDEATAMLAVESAKKAWNNGQGHWPQMTAQERINALENVVQSLKAKREEIVNVLMWEIAKTSDDAAAEFDRTMTFIEASIAAFKAMDASTLWKTVSGIYARVRRAAIGIMLCLGPFNYPFNETYATLIPALLAGNVVIMKIPTIGGLAHILTMEAYAQHLPPGVLTFVSGAGRTTVAPMMATGSIDILAFIGGSHAADTIIKAHPHPHKLNLFLQLEGKNLGIVLPDADIDVAVEQTVLGSTSYNGQRCTAIKLIFVHESVVDRFIPSFVAKVNGLKSGLPWEPAVSITPLPEGAKKIKYLESLIADAVTHGASVINSASADPVAIQAILKPSSNDASELGFGGDVHGLLMKPAVVFPVTSSMKLWHEEQFGPVIPIAVFSDTSDIKEYIEAMPYGQQAAIFSASTEGDTAELVDTLSTVVGRININTQCGRSPDSLPFSGRRSSALGTMSITEALEAFSVPVVLAGKGNQRNKDIMHSLESRSKFMHPLL